MTPSASVLAGALCLSVSAILVKLAGVDAATTAVLRCALAVIVLLPLALHERTRRGHLSAAGLGWSLVAGIALGADYAAWTAAIYHVGAGISTVLVNIQVVVLPTLAYLIDREKVPTRFLLVLPPMLIGITLVGGLWNTGLSGSPAAAGTVLGVVAGIGYAVYLFITRRASRRTSGPVLTLQPLAVATASAALTAAVISPFTGGLHLAQISARSWALLVVLAVVGQVIAWLLIQHGSVHLQPTVTATLLLVQPVLALTLSAAVLDEYPTLLQWIGAAIVLGCVASSRRRAGPSRRGRPAIG